MDAKQPLFGIIRNKVCGAWTPISLYLKHLNQTVRSALPGSFRPTRARKQLQQRQQSTRSGGFQCSEWVGEKKLGWAVMVFCG